MKNKFLILFLSLFLLVPSYCLADDTQEATVLYNEAIDVYGNNEVDKSIELFNKAIELNPSFYEAYYNLAQILMSLDRNDEAIKPLEEILKLKPNDSETLYNLGKIQYKKGYLSKSHKYLSQIKPEDAQYDSAKILINRIELRQQELNIESKLKEHKNIVDTQGLNVATPITNFEAPSGVAVDSLGNIYVASFSQNCIYKITPLGKKTILSKSNIIKGPIGIVADKNDNIYVANYSANNVIKINRQGNASVFAKISKPYCITYDENNNRLYATEQNTNKLFKFDL